jgi:glycosyltransferase involved in cell wall biosynthesis
MQLDAITPVILTFNESLNIGRTLERLPWASRIVVVDSFSDDETGAIVAGYPKAELFRRRFDSHANQWNFAVHETGINTEWVLALDADFQVTEELTREIEALIVEPAIGGFQARFVYCVYGKALRGAAYPPVTVLFRGKHATYVQDGHTQRVRVKGRVDTLNSSILHDDRKPLSRWLVAQARYMQLEADKLWSTPFSELGTADRLRRMIVVAPVAMLFYCLFAKGNLFNGRAGLVYALQRTLAELMLSLFLLERGFVVRV